MNKKIIFILSFVLLLTFSFDVSANMEQWLNNENKDLANNSKVKINDYMNWEEYTITAKGFGVMPKGMSEEQGKLLARESAITLAQRNLVAKIKGLHINSSTTVEKLVNKEDKITRTVQGSLKGATIIEEKAVGQESYKVVMKVNILGKNSVVKYLFPNGLDIKDNNEYVKWSESSKGKRYKKEQSKTNDKYFERKYSGVIINVNNNQAQTALYPKIISKDDELLYGVDTLNQNNFDKGIVVYAKSLADAKTKNRIGDNPLIIDTNEVSGEYNTDIVLSIEKAKKFIKYGKNNNLLQNNKVVIVINN